MIFVFIIFRVRSRLNVMVMMIWVVELVVVMKCLLVSEVLYSMMVVIEVRCVE